MRTQPICITNNFQLDFSSIIVPQVLRGGYGVSLRPYIDTGIVATQKASSNPTSGYKFSFKQCPLPPALGPFAMDFTWKGGLNRRVYFLDDRPVTFLKPFESADLVLLGYASMAWGVASGGNLIPPQQVAPASWNGIRQPQLMAGVLATVFESPTEALASPAVKFHTVIPLFFDDTFTLTYQLPKSAPASFPYTSDGIPAVKSPINWWGLNDECVIAGGKTTVGAFYLFDQIKSYRIVLSLAAGQAPGDVDIWTMSTMGVASPARFQQIIETIPASAWTADGFLVIERDVGPFANSWVQLAAPNNGQFNVDSAQATVEF